MEFNDLLNSLVDIIKIERPNFDDLLNRGINNFPENLELPQDVKSIYRWRNGTDRNKIQTLGDAYLNPPYYLLSIKDGLRLIEESKSFCPIGGKWFPLMADDAGGKLYVECGKNASPQIILWDIDDLETQLKEQAQLSISHNPNCEYWQVILDQFEA